MNSTQVNFQLKRFDATNVARFLLLVGMHRTYVWLKREHVLSTEHALLRFSLLVSIRVRRELTLDVEPLSADFANESEFTMSQVRSFVVLQAIRAY